MKEKKRYVSFRVEGGRFAKADVVRSLWSAVLGTLGALGAARAEFMVVDFDEASQKGILRCSAKELDVVRASIALLDKIGSGPAFVRVTDVTGTIKKSKRGE
jgi:ribonuclease P/MRP protein subunit POP5